MPTVLLNHQQSVLDLPWQSFISGMCPGFNSVLDLSWIWCFLMFHRKIWPIMIYDPVVVESHKLSKVAKIDYVLYYTAKPRWNVSDIFWIHGVRKFSSQIIDDCEGNSINSTLRLLCPHPGFTYEIYGHLSLPLSLYINPFIMPPLLG